MRNVRLPHFAQCLQDGIGVDMPPFVLCQEVGAKVLPFCQFSNGFAAEDYILRRWCFCLRKNGSQIIAATCRDSPVYAIEERIGAEDVHIERKRVTRVNVLLSSIETGEVAIQVGEFVFIHFQQPLTFISLVVFPRIHLTDEVINGEGNHGENDKQDTDACQGISHEACKHSHESRKLCQHECRVMPFQFGNLGCQRRHLIGVELV